jgi:hypothetical protein
MMLQLEIKEPDIEVCVRSAVVICGSTTVWVQRLSSGDYEVAFHGADAMPSIPEFDTAVRAARRFAMRSEQKRMAAELVEKHFTE